MPNSIRFGRAAAQSFLDRSTNIPVITSFTVCGIVRINTNNANAHQPIVAFGRASGPTADAFFNFSDTNAANKTCISSFDGTTNNIVAFASNMVLGLWYEFYLRCSGTGANLLQGGYRLLGALTWSTAVTTLASTATFTGATYRLGADLFAGWIDGNLGGVKMFNRALTDDEVGVEVGSALPVNSSGLNSCYPQPDALDQWRAPRTFRSPTSRFPDWSGNALSFTTETGAVDIEPSPQRWSLNRGIGVRMPFQGKINSGGAVTLVRRTLHDLGTRGGARVAS